jgi:hypothetical protein
VKPFRGKVDEALPQCRATVLCERVQVDRDEVPQREKPL